MRYKYTLLISLIAVVMTSVWVVLLIADPLQDTSKLVFNVTALYFIGLVIICAEKSYKAERAYELRQRTEAQLQHLTKLDEVFPHE